MPYSRSAQNIPEGTAVAAALVAAGYSRSVGAGIAFVSGLVEPVGGLLVSSLAWFAASLMIGVALMLVLRALLET